MPNSDKLREMTAQLRESAELENPEPVAIDVRSIDEAADELDALKELLSLSLAAIARLLTAGDSIINHISDFAGCYCNDEAVFTCGWCRKVDEWKTVRGY